MSDGDEKKPPGDDEDFSFLDELGDLIDEDLNLADDPDSDEAGEDDLEVADLEVTDGAPELAEDAAEVAEIEIDLSENEPESAPLGESMTLRDDDVLELLDADDNAAADADDGDEFETAQTPSVDSAEDTDHASEHAVEEVVESVPFEPLYELEQDDIEKLTGDVAEVTEAIADEEIVADLASMDDDEVPGAEADVEPIVDFEPTAVAPSFEEANLVDSEKPIAGLDDEIDRPVAAATGAVTDASASLDKGPTKPFDLRKPETYDRMAVAPAVPRSRSMSRGLLKVGIGLALGAIALQFAVWWGLGKDPLGLSKLAPSWILPSSLKSDSMTAAAPRSVVSPNSPSAKSDEAEFVPGQRVDTDVSPGADEGENTDLLEDLAGESGGDSTATGDPMGDLNLETNEDLQLEDPLGDFPLANEGSGTTEPGQASRNSEFAEAPSPQAEDPVWETGEADASPFDKPGPKDVPSFSSNDLAAAVAAAKASDEKLDGARINKPPDDDDQLLWKEARKSAAEEFYRAFADLSEKATFVHRDGAEEVLAKLRELLGSFEFDDTKQRMIANATRNWIKNDLGRGVFGAANVTGIQPMGDLHQLQLTLMGREATPITVVTRLVPDNNELARFSVGDRILFLGTIIKNAKERIEGYTGMEESVIWMTDQVVTIP